MNNPNPLRDSDIRTRVLELTYELEGLLNESLSRDEAPELILRLIGAKIRLIGSYAVAPAESASAPLPEPSDNDGNLPDEEKIEEPVLPGADIDASGQLIVAMDELNPDTEADNPHKAEDPSCATVTSEQDPSSDSCDYDLDDDEPVSPAHVRQEPSRRAPVFSLNDRFLYSRELFGGSVADFERALTQVAAMDSYEEAEEYFYSEWGFNAENPVVADFLVVISNYF